MARNRKGEIVDGTSIRNSANGSRRTYCTSQSRIGCGLPNRQFAYRLPNPLLEGGSPNVQIEIEIPMRGVNVLCHLCREIFGSLVVANQVCIGESLPKIFYYGCRILSDQYRYDTLFARRRKDDSKLGLGYPIVEHFTRGTVPAGLELRIALVLHLVSPFPLSLNTCYTAGSDRVSAINQHA